ncbi:MAG: transcription elongation factor Spt5 [Nanoarchaeota archaeon]
MIFIVKVATNKEDKAVEMIAQRAEKKNLNVNAVVRPHGLRGYIILEALDRESAEESAFNLPYVKGIIGKTITYEEIKKMLEPKVEEMNIQIGDMVEMIGQTFKGEKAKVTRIDKAKGEIIVSLLGASVPIPVTVKIDNVKVIRRESDSNSDESSRDSGEDEL